mmetsp:Transcript_101017/g.290691  ORF Transcript_101017/g.290691 Transcript_101017/m.290691 type:complete len:240 (+) Transcript_101017:1-720(+)
MRKARRSRFRPTTEHAIPAVLAIRTRPLRTTCRTRSWRYSRCRTTKCPLAREARGRRRASRLRGARKRSARCDRWLATLPHAPERRPSAECQTRGSAPLPAQRGSRPRPQTRTAPQLAPCWGMRRRASRAPPRSARVATGSGAPRRNRTSHPGCATRATKPPPFPRPESLTPHRRRCPWEIRGTPRSDRLVAVTGASSSGWGRNRQSLHRPRSSRRLQCWLGSLPRNPTSKRLGRCRFW